MIIMQEAKIQELQTQLNEAKRAHAALLEVAVEYVPNDILKKALKDAHTNQDANSCRSESECVPG